ncbi:MAG: PEGA domain-containing protein [Acidobacteria bacterium]|nr:PEGA domain-containing protein [Acidobacteriota bacterium]
MRRLTLGLVAALALLSAPVAQAQEVDPEALRLLLGRAETLLRAGNTDTALDALDRLVARAETVNAGSPGSLRTLLRRALETSVTTRHANGTDGIDAHLDRLIQLDPAYAIAAITDDDDLLNRFGRRRERLVGFLRVGIAPADAEIMLNGVALEDPPEIIPVLAGDHVVSARRRGYAGQQEEVSVRANRTEGVGLTLERSSATVQVATIPPGARVVLDGEAVGFTLERDDEDSSAPLLVEGLLPGWHEIEISLPDHRPFRQRFEVPNLVDYDLGTLTMRLAVGNVTLGDVPNTADVWADGERITTSRNGDSSRFQLAVGDHSLLVGAPGGRVWEGSVTVVDGGNASRDIELRPGMAFLGVAGGDALDRDSANAPLLRALQGLRGWTIIDRSLYAADLTPAEALALGTGAHDDIRCRFEDEAPVGLFVIGALDPNALSTVVLNVWAVDSELPPAQITLQPNSGTDLTAELADLEVALLAARAWHGLAVVDAQSGPMVAAVSAGSPGDSAGFAPGDRLTSLPGGSVQDATAFASWMEAAGPQRRVEIGIERAGSSATLQLDLAPSPQIGAPPSAVTALAWWARAGAGIAAADVGQPIWALHLQQALMLIENNQIDAAIDMLWDAAAPADAPFGQAAVDYWLGLALTLGDAPDLDAARNAFNRAASADNGRLFHNDGPLVGPRARARIRRIAASQ